MIKRQRISITGRVQGVGCRPFIHSLAAKLHLTGCVYNDTKGVHIELQGPEPKIQDFLKLLRSPKDCPALLEITSMSGEDVPVIPDETEFLIRQSDSAGTPLSQVTPDIATCKDCLSELADADDFRYRYPFINCTNCGPRYSIVKTIPYDRPNTTMAEFAMCPKCKAQYTDVADRRFHAQPVACSHCGPKISLTDPTGKTIETDPDKAVAKTAELLLDGKIVAIKGVGGFHLAVDALNDQAVKRLRLRKRRDHKPFAMMAAAVEKIKQFALLDSDAEKILRSPQSPIVLLKQKPDNLIAPSVAAGVNTFAFMLCYAPLHHLLFAEKDIEVLVMTSANVSDEPLICKNRIALQKLGSVADAFLVHDRVIHRQLDDSVVHFIHDKVAFLRRARGYVPAPVIMKKPSPRDIFAAGADLKNTFCFVRQNQLIVSEHIGDLEDADVYRHYASSVPRLQKLFEASPRVAVCDLHPGYLSTQYARSLKAEKLITVQHHWAHIASVLAEYDYHDPVIGLVADGTGFGTDSAVWGCECLIASLKEFERFGHLAYYPLPGADKASKESIRPLLGLLRACSDGDLLEKYAWLLEPIEPDTKKLKVILDQLDKNLNTVQTSSLGRLFDAVAAILGLGSYNHFEAQLPMALEAIVDENITQTYDFQMISDSERTIRLDFRNIIDGILHDVKNDILPGVISAKFHNTLAGAFMDFAARAKDKYGLNTVALSGGVFCNRYLSDLLITLLKEDGFSVLFNRLVPANDGGIALGQAAIAVENIQNL